MKTEKITGLKNRNGIKDLTSGLVGKVAEKIGDALWSGGGSGGIRPEDWPKSALVEKDGHKVLEPELGQIPRHDNVI